MNKFEQGIVDHVPRSVSPLLALAERVEALTGPCRETDREILFATFPKERTAIFDGVKHISTMTGRDGEPWFNPLADRTDCPHYTEDATDALTLKPPRHRILLDERPDSAMRADGWRCEVYKQGHPYKSDNSDKPTAWAATAANAITAASLRARARARAAQDAKS